MKSMEPLVLQLCPNQYLIIPIMNLQHDNANLGSYMIPLRYSKISIYLRSANSPMVLPFLHV